MARKVTLNYLKEELKKFEIEPKDDKCFLPGLVLLASVVCGPNTDKIAKFIKQPRSVVRDYGKVIRKNGIWKQDKIDCEWFDKDTGGVAFLCDVLVASGVMERKIHA